ncbi:hypothetical protein PG994_003368 [Apiospora phragmitis]|uniref:Uncharacterized protein n=1 Tax=Apiospora phragmitis TaxID=2905665 RepID=A0ABR1VXW9_9PEZI
MPSTRSRGAVVDLAAFEQWSQTEISRRTLKKVDFNFKLKEVFEKWVETYPLKQSKGKKVESSKARTALPEEAPKGNRVESSKTVASRADEEPKRKKPGSGATTTAQEADVPKSKKAASSKTNTSHAEEEPKRKKAGSGTTVTSQTVEGPTKQASTKSKGAKSAVQPEADPAVYPAVSHQDMLAALLGTPQKAVEEDSPNDVLKKAQSDALWEQLQAASRRKAQEAEVNTKPQATPDDALLEQLKAAARRKARGSTVDATTRSTLGVESMENSSDEEGEEEASPYETTAVSADARIATEIIDEAATGSETSEIGETSGMEFDTDIQENEGEEDEEEYEDDDIETIPRNPPPAAPAADLDVTALLTKYPIEILQAQRLLKDAERIPL